MNSQNIFSIADRVDESLYKIEKFLLCFLLTAMIMMAFTSLVMRLLFNLYSAGIIDIIQNMVLWCTFLGGSIATRADEHLNINVFQSIIYKSKYKNMIQIILYTAVGVICACLAWSGYKFCVSQFNFSEDLPSAGIKLWTLQTILPYTFFVVSIRCSIKALKGIIGIDKKEVQHIDAYFS
jgi:TRAP-type C4-dicarboxylate transport system permease small subunit